MQISLIMTVFNEADNITKVLNSLTQQSRRPEEVVIVDGGSNDGTLTCIQEWATQNFDTLPLKLLRQPGANISQGRNTAISHASFPFIAATDAGTQLEPDWLAQLVTALKQTHAEVVAGFFQADPDPTSPWEIALGATSLPIVDEIQPAKFLPSSRSVAFSKVAWQKSGGYPEWLDYCEDLIFDLNLQKQGYNWAWCPQAVAHFRPRATPTAFFKQYYRYARGDGKANLFRKRHLLRYTTYFLFGPLMVGLSLKKGWGGLLLLGASFAYLRTPYRRLWWHTPRFKSLGLVGKLQALLWIPVVRAIGDIAKMCGYPVGLMWRWQNRDKIEVSPPTLLAEVIPLIRPAQ